MVMLQEGFASVASPTLRANTAERIINIIQRDLMLGSTVNIAVDTKLFGGDFDLDSLDALLLMQSLEKEFGFKMPSESFRPEVFENVERLARFVDGHASGASRSEVG